MVVILFVENVVEYLIRFLGMKEEGVFVSSGECLWVRSYAFGVLLDIEVLYEFFVDLFDVFVDCFVSYVVLDFFGVIMIYV